MRVCVLRERERGLGFERCFFFFPVCPPEKMLSRKGERKQSHLLERPGREHAHERRLACVLEADERELHLLVEEEAGCVLLFRK